MSASVEARIAEAEQLREDILNDRQQVRDHTHALLRHPRRRSPIIYACTPSYACQILEFEQRRSGNEDIIKQIRALRAKAKGGAQEKTYVLVGDLFIRQTNSDAEALLVRDTSHSLHYL